MDPVHPNIRAILLGMTILVVAAAVGCGTETTEPVLDDRGAIVTPEIRIAGLEEIGDSVHLEDLYLGIGEIRLEPVAGDDEVTYVTRSPLFLHFDLNAGEWTLEGVPMTLPQRGAYMVSLRMDPMDDGNGMDTSMRVDGLMANFVGNHDFLNAASIEPTPLPMRTVQGGLGGNPTPEVAWVPWTYSTTTTVNVALNNVDFDNGAQTLVINFDVSRWVTSALDPIVAEVKARRSDTAIHTPLPDYGPVDVSRSVDESQGGVEYLGAWSEAFSR